MELEVALREILHRRLPNMPHYQVGKALSGEFINNAMYEVLLKIAIKSIFAHYYNISLSLPTRQYAPMALERLVLTILPPPWLLLLSAIIPEKMSSVWFMRMLAIVECTY